MKEKDFEKMQELLPDTAKKLVSLVGIENTCLLIKHFGGTTFPVSQNKRQWGVVRYEMLAEVIGVTAADILTNHFGGCELYIPRCLDAITEVRDRMIRNEFDRITIVEKSSGNHAVTVLALKHRLSDRQIWNIISRPDRVSETSIQTPLF